MSSVCQAPERLIYPAHRQNPKSDIIEIDTIGFVSLCLSNKLSFAVGFLGKFSLLLLQVILPTSDQGQRKKLITRLDDQTPAIIVVERCNKACLIRLKE